ncbi:MAG TPA: RND transporter [Gammaproteobacteria bacterium]|nr:RND transporter [Gammaproteobacteria bacterium]
MKWLEKIPLGPLVLAAAFMALLPFRPQPHLWEKLGMLVNAQLTQAVDIFDLLWHSALIFLVLVKIFSVKTKES